jgi:hypothetical protein
MEVTKFDVLLTVHHGALMNQQQLDGTLFLVCLLGDNASYMFRALLAHLQEVLHSCC